MAKQMPASPGMGMPTAAMLMIGILSALTVGLSFFIIRYWPVPASVAPYMGFTGGFWWGLVVGGISGLVLGFVTDDNHFIEQKQSSK
jgi:thiamine transporter ThiT